MKKLECGKIVIFLFLFFILFEGVKAGEYFPPSSVTVSSIYWDPVGNTWGNQVEWLFSRPDTSRLGEAATIEVKKGGEDSPTMLLHYGTNGELIGLERFPVQGGQRVRMAEDFTEKLVLSDGFPVPYDYLAPDNATLKKVTIKKKTGGAVFSYQAEREITGVSFAQALQDEMIPEAMKNDVSGKVLKLITVKKNDQFTAKQLWAEGITWWIYEETPYRKSWLREIAMEN